MKSKLLLLLLMAPFCMFAQLQINAAEYFIDNDPGVGSGTALSTGSTADSVSFNAPISISALSQGFHILGIRTHNTSGLWSLTEARSFYIYNQPANLNLQVTAAEYFYDTDPGVGQATRLNVGASADSISFNANVSASALTPGFHIMGLRTKDSLGHWAITEARPFYIYPMAPNLNRQITAAEFFFDADPGVGAAIPLNVGGIADSVSFNPNINTNALTSGFHILGIRTKDSLGHWSATEARPFYIYPITPNLNLQITAAEYFFDTDPGAGAATVISVGTAADSISSNSNISASALTSGFHIMGLRTKDSLGHWSITEARPFYIYPLAPNPNLQITSAEYFFDTDPGVGSGSVIAIGAPADSVAFNYGSTNIALSNGPHIMVVRTQDSLGHWSINEARNFMVGLCSLSASVAAAGDTNICQGNSVTLSTSSATPNLTYQWLNGGNILSGDTNANVAANISGMYYAVVTDSVGCMDTTNAIAVTVNALPDTIVSITGFTTFCQGDSAVLTAAPGLQSYQWNTGATTQSITVTIAGNYSATLTNSYACTVTSQTVAVTITHSEPGVITHSGATTFCNGDSVQLAAQSGQSYQWSNGATTQNITVNQAGNYSVLVTVNNGCTAVSDTVIVTVNASPPANITPSGAITFCAGDSVSLSAPSGLEQYSWNTGATTQTITTDTSGNFSVTVTNSNNCSAVSTPVTVTVNSLPSATITAGGATTFCEGGSVSLNAPAGLQYNWSNGATAQTITSDTSGTFSVTVTNSNNCSAVSAPVVVTVNPLPSSTITTVGVTTFCEGDRVSLSAPAGLQYNWSNVATSQTITVYTSGTFSVTVTNNNNCSAVSTPVAVTVNALPVVTLSGLPDTVCANHSLTLTGGSPAGGTYSGPAVTAGVFNPDNTNVGTNTITYVYTDTATSCSNTATQTIIVEICTGLDELSLSNIRIFPNPTGDVLNIYSNNNENLWANLTDINGKVLIENITISSGVRTLNLLPYSAGVYLLQLRNINGNLQTVKVVKQ
jgi:hypothetical protein